MRPEPYEVKRQRQMERQEDVVDKDCFWDSNPASVILQGTPLCAIHAVCATCGTPLYPDRKPVVCVCVDYWALGHEEALWCSLGCMEAMHPGAEEELNDPEGV